MSPTVLIAVEGQGDVHAAPVLCKRIASEISWYPAWHPVRLQLPISRLSKAADFARMYATDAVLVLQDADVLLGCVPSAATEATEELSRLLPDRPVATVVADSEFESWFLPCLGCLAGRLGLKRDARPPANLRRRDAKSFISGQMAGSRRYKPTVDQALFASHIHLDHIEDGVDGVGGVHSFGNLRRAIAALQAGIGSPARYPARDGH